MKVHSRHRLSMEQAQQRIVAVAVECAEHGQLSKAARSLQLDPRSLSGWLGRHAPFLVVKQLPEGPQRHAERKRRAKAYLRTGKKIDTLPERPAAIDRTPCTRVTGWRDGEAVLCGQLTTYQRCAPCEAALSYPDLSETNALAIVRHARKTRGLSAA